MRQITVSLDAACSQVEIAADILGDRIIDFGRYLPSIIASQVLDADEVTFDIIGRDIEWETYRLSIIEEIKRQADGYCPLTAVV